MLSVSSVLGGGARNASITLINTLKLNRFPSYPQKTALSAFLQNNTPSY
jgi:hypothetical protein